MVEIEKLLKEAYIKYPPGTKYWNLSMNGSRSVPDIDINKLPVTTEYFKFEISKTKSTDGTPIIIAIDTEKNVNQGWVYANGIWAETIFDIYELW